MTSDLTIRDFLVAGRTAVRGALDKNADFRTGSDYDSLNGPTAIIWSRQSARDTDLFNSVNFNTAVGDDLTQLALRRFGKVRGVDSRGTGTVTLVRPSGGVSETLWTGSRFTIPGSSPKVYRTTADALVGTSDLQVTIPIEAVSVGPGSAINLTVPMAATVDNLFNDSTWYVRSLQCDDGTTFESAPDFRARIRQERYDARVGQTKAIITACNAAGAQNVVLFRSDYAGDSYDYGLNYCYVGDSGYNASQDLVRACALALEGVRVEGDCLQVLPMAPSVVNVTANVTLYDTPAVFDLTRLERLEYSSLLQYLNGLSGRFTYSLDGLIGAIAKPTPEVQRVSLVTPTSDASIVVGSDKNFPAVLNRYILGNVSLNYVGP